MNDPLVLFAFVIVYLTVGVGLLVLAGGFNRPRLRPVLLKSELRGEVPRMGRR